MERRRREKNRVFYKAVLPITLGRENRPEVYNGGERKFLDGCVELMEAVYFESLYNGMGYIGYFSLLNAIFMVDG